VCGCAFVVCFVFVIAVCVFVSVLCVCCVLFVCGVCVCGLFFLSFFLCVCLPRVFLCYLF